MSLEDMLSRGYFPKELPRPFVTTGFANFITSQPSFSNAFGITTPPKKVPLAKVDKYSLARVGLLRRQLSIANPLPQYYLSREIFSNWATLGQHIGGTRISGTIPEFKASGRAINGRYGQGDRTLLGRKVRLGEKFILKTDISRFYNSIYTHSIPWALHGKPFSKKNRSPTILGNKLDFWIRQGQDGQTIGIPIGPDTSLVIAEIIMQKCDEELISKIPQIKGYRFIDDYELAFPTRTEAEDAFYILESCLSEYELALNPKKTIIFELPQPFENEWVAPLKNFPFRTSGKNTGTSQAADLEAFFDLAFQLQKKGVDESVLQYALARLRQMTIHPANWELFQNLLYLCLPEPATLPYVLEQIISRVNLGMVSEKIELEAIINRIIVEHAELKHSSEVANSLWATLVLGLKISSAAGNALSKCDDSVVALLALDCENNGLITTPLSKSLWAQHMTPEGLYDDHWLLAYEANIKNWLPNANGTDFVAADQNFGLLKSNNVAFYDSSLGVPVTPNAIPTPSLPTIHLSAFSSP